MRMVFSAIRHLAVNERGYRIGEDHHNARYTNGEVEMVLVLRDEGLGYKAIAKRMEMPVTTVRDICLGRRRSQLVAGVRKVENG